MKNKEIKLVNELFELWENFAQAGELSIGYGFNENYKRLKEQVLILNKVGVTLKEKNTPTFDSWIKENCHQTKNKNLFIKDEKLLTRIELASIYERLKSDL